MNRKKLLTTIFVALLCLGVNAQTEDSVLMTIDGVPVTSSEFEHAFNKNRVNQGEEGYTVESYLPMFVDFKLKVAEAKAQKLDTMKSFKDEYAKDRKMLAADYLTDGTFVEKEAYRIYAKDSALVGNDGILKVTNIAFRLPQNATDKMIATAKAKIDSAYSLLQSGVSFIDAAKAVGVPESSVRDFEIVRGQTYEEFENVAYSLADGAYSEPFRSPAALHIVKRISTRPFGTFEEYREPIIKMLEQQNIQQVARLKKGMELAEAMGGDITPEQALAREDSLLEVKYPEFGMLMKEYYEGLLFFEISNREVWNTAKGEEAELAKFFKKNKKRYKFDTPRYKGAVVYAATQQVLDKAQAMMNGKSSEEYRSIVKEHFMSDSARIIRVEIGVYAIGDNKWVDKMAFGQGEGGRKRADLPYVGVVGKIIDAPEEYTDVKGAVTADFNKVKEEKWVKKLRKKYKVEINKEVLKTVNNHE